MSRSVLHFLPWHTPAHGQAPEKALVAFADLMAEQRKQAAAFLPAKPPTDPVERARIDGLIATLWLLDGLLQAGTDRAAGRHPRQSIDELDACGVTAAHFVEQRVDFAWRRYIEQQVRRCRSLLQAAAPLGKPWIKGARYRLCIARSEQILRRLQLDPALAYGGEFSASFWDNLTASIRIGWRVLTKRR